jgi:hypothetical protein
MLDFLRRTPSTTLAAFLYAALIAFAVVVYAMS